MNKSQFEFLHILSDYVNHQKKEYIISPELLSYAKSQEVEGIIYRQTKAAELKYKYAFAIYMYQNRIRLLNELNELLMGVPHFYVKGLEVASYYPDPSLRTMGDIDLLIREEDIPKIVEIFRKKKFVTEVLTEGIMVAHKEEYEFEIHTSLIHSGIGNERAKEYFSNCWDFVSANKLDRNYHFIFVIQHLKGHMVSEGVGFRQFIDVALLSKDPELNWSWIERELEKIDLLNFAEKVLAFNKRWFNVDTPVAVKEIEDSFFEEATEKIFRGGVFGHDDDTNRNAGIVKQAINNNSNLIKAQLAYLLSELFPSWQIMCTLPYCKYVEKTVFLLPIAWLHRIVYRGWEKGFRQRFLNRVIMSDDVKERRDLLQKWGL